ncbi:hypothetical protein W97_07261 [Coniosporium apollinis CBS 100218]|uniref:SIS domain-containing protein n=1 Tax=Coniosporium apollinis (strain CBS 100218) TaxID=1168221 RepID=R7Z212_CONA1|nr:uncharacterized protein W97_07261 [Coniosporium apollinis CBS 100218]EON68113.1 hypothetical protein W97_07261 [Coniosporium apollinis CBS 100218]
MALTALPSPTPEHTEGLSLAPIPTLRPLKRKRTLPTTPPAAIEDPESANTLERAVHVLSTEATALSHVTRLYQTNPAAKHGLLSAVETVVNVNEAGGKLVVCGVGKSGLVGMKTVATMKSLGLGASFMHAGEALHGDLGDVRPNDALLLITFSGRTAELLSLLPHIPSTTPILVLTSHTTPAMCPLLALRPDAILLPGPIHESEEESFGVAAPTTSTTVAMAIGDMLALTAVDRIHGERTRKVFKKNHPGGAIGARARTADPVMPAVVDEGVGTPESV